MPAGNAASLSQRALLDVVPGDEDAGAGSDDLSRAGYVDAPIDLNLGRRTRAEADLAHATEFVARTTGGPNRRLVRNHDSGFRLMARFVAAALHDVLFTGLPFKLFDA